MPRLPLIASAAAVAILAVAGLGTWFLFLRGDEPAEVSLADAVAAASTPATAVASGPADATPPATPPSTSPSTAPTTSTGAAPASDAGTPPAGTAAGEGGLAGTWTVDPGASFVGYRIDEELRVVGATTAVGRTSAVEGSLEFDGATITAVEVTADLTRLQSDDSRRDGQLRRQALETDRFPEALFVLAEPIAVNGDPADGQPIATTAVGELTLHGVTNRVELALEGQFVDGAVVVVGATVIRLADYDIDQPSALSVLSVSDEATMEMQLVFRRA